MAKLTAKQQRFVDEYIVDLNATAAAIRAGYSEQTAAVIGHENLRKPNIDLEIKKRMAERSNKLGLDAEWVLNRLKNISDAAFESGDYNPANKSAELIGKHLGMFTDKLEVKGTMTIEQILDELD